MPYHLPGTQLSKQISAWELVVVSVILLAMICYRISPKMPEQIKFVPNGVRMAIQSIMGENYNMHTCLYVVLFIMVLSATVMGFFYDEE